MERQIKILRNFERVLTTVALVGAAIFFIRLAVWAIWKVW